MSGFDADSTADDVINGISLTNKVVAVTGASSGLGIETSRVLAAAGATVLMLARDRGKLDAAAALLRAAGPSLKIDTGIVDLANLDSVRSAASSIVASYPRIDLLINNAGVMACPFGRTTQGFEMQFGTNHLGHFLLTSLLLPSLIESGNSRVISLSSSGHKFSHIDFDDPNYEHREYEKWVAYGQSKTANALFAVGLDDRLKDQGVRALAVHPGVILTNLSRHMLQEDYDMFEARSKAGQETKFKSIPQGSATSVWAATSPDLQGRGALYLEDCQVAKPTVAGVDGGVESYALDHGAAERLWELSEQMVGQIDS